MKLISILSLLCLTAVSSSHLRAASSRHLQEEAPPLGTTFSAQYRANFLTTSSDNCETPPVTILQALCRGTITLGNVSSSSITCSAISDLLSNTVNATMTRVEGYYGSGLICQINGALGSVDYKCEGTMVNHVDSEIVYGEMEEEEEEEDVGISRQEADGCDYQHFSQLSVTCGLEDVYFADAAYFECDRPSRMTNRANIPTNELLCTNAVCDDEDDDCDPSITRVVAEPYNFGRACISITSDTFPVTIPPFPKPTVTPREPGSYLATYQVNYGYLLKDAARWANAEAANCTGELPSIKLVCGEGMISMPFMDNDIASPLACTMSTDGDVYVCEVPPPGPNATAIPFEEYINRFDTLVYTCNATNVFPTTRVEFEPGEVSCDFFEDDDEIAAIHALQLGIQCQTQDDEEEMEVRYDEFYYECVSAAGTKFHLLDEETNGDGDVFTCIKSAVLKNETGAMSAYVASLRVESDWRLANFGDDSCYQYIVHPNATLAPTDDPILVEERDFFP